MTAARIPADGGAARHPVTGSSSIASRAISALVESGVWVAISATMPGAWLAIAVDGHVDYIGSAGHGLFLFVVYALDRMGAHPEDAGARSPGVLDPAAFARRHRRGMRVSLAAAAGSLVALGVLVRPWLLLAAAASLAAATFYFVPVPGLGRRIKTLPFVKHAYAPLVLTAFCALFLRRWPDARSAGAFAVVAVTYQLNNWVFDIKDAEADRRAGIVLLTGLLAPRTLLAGLAAESLLAAALAAWLLPPGPVAVGAAVGLGAHTLALLALRRRFVLRTLFVTFEALLVVPAATALALQLMR